MASKVSRQFFRWVISLLATLGLVFTCLCYERAGAQDAGSPARNVQALKGDEFVLGRQIAVDVYNPNQAIQWGIDFVVSPSAAKDRVVLYGYDSQKTDADFFRKLESLILDKQPLISIISSSVSGGGENGKLTSRPSDFAVPIILDPQKRAFVSSFISLLADPKKAAFILPAVIAVSALKSQGLDWEGTSLPRTSVERPWSFLIASSIPVSDHPKAVLYLGLKSGWNVSKNPPEAMATRAEVQKLMDKI